jgi:hypothetical protein
MLGAMAMPIFAFFIAEGYAHTRNLPAYARRMTIFAAISYFPFVFFVSAIWDESLTLASFGRLNMIYTLLLGLAALWVWDHLQQPELKLYLHEQYSFVGTEKEDEFWFFDYVGESGFTPFITSYEPAGEQPFSDAVFLHLSKWGEETALTIICSEDMAVIDLEELSGGQLVQRLKVIMKA